MQSMFRYVFGATVCREDVEAAFLLAVLATESLHGEAETRLNARHVFDPDRMSAVVDAGTLVGQDLNRVFVGFLRRELLEDEFQVERVADELARQPETAGAA